MHKQAIGRCGAIHRSDSCNGERLHHTGFFENACDGEEAIVGNLEKIHAPPLTSLITGVETLTPVTDQLNFRPLLTYTKTHRKDCPHAVSQSDCWP